MGIKVIFSVRKMYDRGREIPAHNYAHGSGTRGSLIVHEGTVDVRGKHHRHTQVAELVSEAGVPIEGFRMHDVRITSVTAERMMVYGVERHEDVGVHDHAQAWWCIPVDGVPLQD